MRDHIFFFFLLVDSCHTIQDSVPHFPTLFTALAGFFYRLCVFSRCCAICISVRACVRGVLLACFFLRRAVGRDIKPTFLRGLPLHCSRAINARARPLQMSSHMLNVARWHINMLGEGEGEGGRGALTHNTLNILRDLEETLASLSSEGKLLPFGKRRDI